MHQFSLFVDAGNPTPSSVDFFCLVFFPSLPSSAGSSRRNDLHPKVSSLLFSKELTLFVFSRGRKLSCWKKVWRFPHFCIFSLQFVRGKKKRDKKPSYPMHILVLFCLSPPPPLFFDKQMASRDTVWGRRERRRKEWSIYQIMLPPSPPRLRCCCCCWYQPR